MSARCPKCAGTKRLPITEHQRPYCNVMAGYDMVTDTLPCNNCGGQTMEGVALGVVPVDQATGLGCMHAFKGTNAGRCNTRYVCSQCSFTYSIDSGD